MPINKWFLPLRMQIKITPKQLEILELLAEGNSSQEIAKKLENSKKTIDNIRKEMLLRVKVKNVAQLVSWGYKNKVLKI